jgi:uncharacterized protein (DUF58 family)
MGEQQGRGLSGRGLTRRGWVFTFGGGLCLGIGLVGGGDGWQRVGLLLVALPLLSMLLVARTRLGLRATRRVDPARVPVDAETAVTLELESSTFVPAGMLRLEDAVPGTGSTPPRFVIDRGGPRWRRRVSYRLRPRHRGLLTVGPLTVYVEDPFGLVVTSRRLADPTTVVVTPTVVPLPATRIPGEWSGSGESRPRSIAAAGEEDVTVRPYQRGDDRRRVHWRATARHGFLMVRREEQPWQSRATLVLDTRTAAHGQRRDGRRTPSSSSLEWAVVAAASIGTHLLDRGYSVRLVTDEGGTASTAWHDRSEGPGSAEGMLLEALATVTPAADASIGRIRSMLHGAGTVSGLLVAILGRLTADEAATMARLRHDTSAALAVLLDADAWNPAGAPAGALPPEAVAATLRRAGWHVVTVTGDQPSLDDVRVAWAGLAERPVTEVAAPVVAAS